MFADSSIHEAKAQFCRRESNSVLTFPAESLIQQITVSLERGGAVNSLTDLSHSRYSAIQLQKTLLSLRYCICFSSQCNLMIYPVRCLWGIFISSSKDVSSNFWLLRAHCIYAQNIFKSLIFKL